MKIKSRDQGGFTLLEIMVALAITAAGIAAVMKVIGSGGDVMNELDERMVASWVAANQLTELRISPRQPRAGTQTRRVEMGGRTWQYRQEVSDTLDEDVFRVDIEVMRRNDDNDVPLARVFGFIVSQPDVIASRVQQGGNQGGGDE